MRIGQYFTKIWTKLCGLLFWATLYVPLNSIPEHNCMRQTCLWMQTSVINIFDDSDAISCINNALWLKVSYVNCTNFEFTHSVFHFAIVLLLAAQLPGMQYYCCIPAKSYRRVVNQIRPFVDLC